MIYSCMKFSKKQLESSVSTWICFVFVREWVSGKECRHLKGTKVTISEEKQNRSNHVKILNLCHVEFVHHRDSGVIDSVKGIPNRAKQLPIIPTK